MGPSEVRSWHQSLKHMRLVLADPGIPDDSGVSVELQIPQTTKRIDFLLSGRGKDASDHAVIVELKQWETAESTEMDGLVRTFLGGAERDTAHPSYQAWSYAELLKDFNRAVYEGDIELHPCAFLHNFYDRSQLEGPFYEEWVERAPVFVKGEVERLRSFIKRWVRHGDAGDIVVRIDTGEIRPSKSLADSLAKLLEGNREFTMIDDQKVVFERALHLVRTTPGGEKRVLIVHGGPGTGKSVVAVNLLVELIQDIGTRDEIVHWADHFGAEIERLDSGPGRARMVAGYCWPWVSKKDPEAYDVVIPEHDFRMRWNLASDGSLWLVKPESVSEIGCIHTCQGLEMEHVGVIVGPDLEKITTRLRDFAEARRWERFHTPKNLAMALAAEAGELLEHFQWLTPEESSALADDPEALAEVSEELADVAIYLLRLADVMGVDLWAAVEGKIERNEERFPPEAERERESWR